MKVLVIKDKKPTGEEEQNMRDLVEFDWCKTTGDALDIVSKKDYSHIIAFLECGEETYEDFEKNLRDLCADNRVLVSMNGEEINEIAKIINMGAAGILKQPWSKVELKNRLF